MSGRQGVAGRGAVQYRRRNRRQGVDTGADKERRRKV